MIAQEKKGSDWKGSAFLFLGLVVGLLAGYYLNIDLEGRAKAMEICGECQANLGIMVGNFNVLAKECSGLKKDIPLFPPVFGNNTTVSVYAS